jgi:hypothetical protein
MYTALGDFRKNFIGEVKRLVSVDVVRWCGWEGLLEGCPDSEGGVKSLVVSG